MATLKNINCPKCDYITYKNGFIAGKQRYKCEKCGYQFTTLKINEPKRFSFEQKLDILKGLMGGKSARAIEREYGVGRMTIMHVKKHPLSIFKKHAVIENIS